MSVAPSLHSQWDVLSFRSADFEVENKGLDTGLNVSGLGVTSTMSWEEMVKQHMLCKQKRGLSL